MTVHPDEPDRPDGQPDPAGQPADVPAGAVPAEQAPPAATPAATYPASTPASTPGKAKRLLQLGAVGAAGLVAGSALTFAVTANGNTASDGRDGTSSGQFGGPGGQGGMGYARGSQPPGQFGGQGQGTEGGTDQDPGAPDAQAGTQPG